MGNMRLFQCPPLDKVEKSSVKVKFSGVWHSTVEVSNVNSIRAVSRIMTTVPELSKNNT